MMRMPLNLTSPEKIFILASVWASSVSFGLVGLYAGNYNADPYFAINIARHYLHRQDKLAPLFDMVTHGFVHPLIYLPILWILDLIKVPFSTQDGIAIGVVYGITLGLIALLTFVVSRYFHDKFIASLIALLIVASVLVHPMDIDFISPNAELIGSVLLLLYWALLLYRSYFSHAFLLAVIVGVFVFHLKFQLIPQLLIFTFCSKLKSSKALGLFLAILSSSLLVDLIVYRFGSNGSGFFSRLSTLLSDYVLTVNPEYPGIYKSLMLLAPGILMFYPVFLVAWILFFDQVCSSDFRGNGSFIPMRRIVDVALLSVVTLAAIVLPGKNFPHYYILLLPTSVMVLNYALPVKSDDNHHLFNKSGGFQDSPGSPLRIFASFNPVLALIPFFLLTSILAVFSFIFRGNPRWESTMLMTPQERDQGALLYGWGSGYSYGSFGTYPFDPALDSELMGVKFVGNSNRYNQFMASTSDLPPYIIDMAVVKNAEILQGLIRPINELQQLPDNHWAKSYTLIRKNKSGWLYRLKK